MTSLRLSLLALCVALVFSLPAQAQEYESKKASMTDADIVETAMANKNFSTLVSALKAADLVEALQGEGPFTVFAPTNQAFAELPDGTLDTLLKPENKAKLQAILKYHVVSGKVTAKDVIKLEEAKTLQGAKVGIQMEDGTVMLQGKTVASVTKTDIMASNGVIHVIDSVLMPPAQTAQMDEDEDRMGEEQMSND
jgi:uncharacterized surface protein with fasciclin (FAS1) repeats